MRRLNIRPLLGALLIASPVAAETEFGGYVAAEAVYFPDDGLYPAQGDNLHGGLSFAPEFRWTSEDRDTRIRVSAFGRAAGVDADRSHVDLREAYIAHDFGRVEVLAGVNHVFWGVTESRHLVDIINQEDRLEFTDREARLGQPMIMATLDTDFGAFTGYVMTGFREQAFAGEEGRFSFGLPVSEAATYEASDERWAADFALRYTHSFGGVDLGLSAFHGTSREAQMRLNGGELVPHYARISQFGIDAQYTLDALLLKFEGIVREGHGERFEAAVVGAEYTLFQLGGGGSDLGLIAEYLYDGRGPDAPPTPFEEDVFIGARWAANDIQDTSFLIGATVDVDDQTTFVRAEFGRRIGSSVSLDIAAQAVVNEAAGNPLAGFSKDGFLAIDLSYHF